VRRHIFQQPAPLEELTQTYSNLTRADVIGMRGTVWSPLSGIGAIRRLPTPFDVYLSRAIRSHVGSLNWRAYKRVTARQYAPCV
jgi:hypothetical protein